MGSCYSFSLILPYNCNLLQQYVIPALRQRQFLETTVFMQYGAPPHIARQVTALLRTHFGDERVISRGF